MKHFLLILLEDLSNHIEERLFETAIGSTSLMHVAKERGKETGMTLHNMYRYNHFCPFSSTSVGKRLPSTTSATKVKRIHITQSLYNCLRCSVPIIRNVSFWQNLKHWVVNRYSKNEMWGGGRKRDSQHSQSSKPD